MNTTDQMKTEESTEENPAGLVELTDEALDDLIANGAIESGSCAWFSCNGA